ncbi:MAG: hypothetical protein M3478_05440, partial [Planctomycetota bacterium]|nr:hypothetical protein [Planctomycetota bacterium]
MAIAFNCTCGRKINAKDEHAGKRVKCPGCRQAVTVPSAAAAVKPTTVAAAGTKPSAKVAPPAPRKSVAAKPAPPAPVNDDMYDIQDDAPGASPWGDDDGLAPVAAPRPYV